ncbi:UNVERIFIED_CONTAM: hypothetical protein FKN15_069791 [Acipenser sinensis]
MQKAAWQCKHFSIVYEQYNQSKNYDGQLQLMRLAVYNLLNFQTAIYYKQHRDPKDDRYKPPVVGWGSLFKIVIKKGNPDNKTNLLDRATHNVTEGDIKKLKLKRFSYWNGIQCAVGEQWQCIAAWLPVFERGLLVLEGLVMQR